MRDVLGDRQFAVLAPRIARALQGARMEFEIELDLPASGPRILKATYEPELDGDGAVAGVIVSINDISARVMAERALRESEETLRAFYDNAPVCMGVVELTTDGDILHVHDNAASSRFFGCAVDGTRGRRASALGASPDTIAVWRRAYLQSAERGTSLNFEHRFEAADGPRWLSVTVNALPPVSGERSRFCYVADDMTARKRIEQELTQREREFRTMADNIDQLAWSADADGWIHWYNRRWFDYTGSSLAEMEGWGWRAVHHPDHVERVVDHFTRCVTKGEAWEDTFPLRARDGSYRWFLSRAIPIRDDDGRVLRWFGTNTDVTTQREIEHTLREADRRKDEFIATLAHELRNPLSPIRNALEVMRLKGIADPQLEWGRRVIDRQAGHLSRLVDDLLDLSRVSRGRVELRVRPTDLADIVHAAVESVRPQLEEQAQTLEVELPAEPVRLQADPVRLTQIVTNLLSNSVKYTQLGGRVRLSAMRSGDVVDVVVQDDGVGIAPEMLPRIFDMFMQVDRGIQPGGGLGIGLTLVRQLVDLHGGTITAHSAGLGQGSTFRVRLPIGDPAEDVGTEPPQAAVGLAPRRILVADDNPDNVDSLALLLQMIGHEVHVAVDGRAALAAAERFRPDVILLDLGMPELDGYEVCRAIRRMDWGCEVLIIALTGWGQDEDRRRTGSAGFDHHLTKPLHFGELEALLVQRANG